MLTFSVATASDFRRFYKRPVPGFFTALVARWDGRVVGIGGCLYDDEGRAWGFMDDAFPEGQRPPGFAFALHRQAKRFFDVMQEVGEPVVYTFAEARRSPRAVAWLQRLGFEQTDELGPTEQVIWKWPQLSP